MPLRFIAEQLSHPRGIGGWLVRLGMNRGNARVNAFALDRLNLQPTDKVLEIGFGGGMNIRRILGECSSVTGLDRSGDAVAAANRRFRGASSAGRASFLLGDVEALPFAAHAFSKALTVHTVYFWASLDKGFNELYRCLQPGGMLAVGFLPKARKDLMRMPDDVFTTREPDSLSAAAAAAGFKVDMVRPQDSTQWMVLICQKAEVEGST